MPDASVQRKLHNWQMLLLDLTRANRLLYFKAERGSAVPITQPTSTELFQLLVTQGKQLKFPAADASALFEEEESSGPIRGALPDSPASLQSTAQPVSPGEAEAATAPSSAALPHRDQTPPLLADQTTPGSAASIMSSPADQSAGDTATPAEAGLNGITAKARNNMLASSLSEAKLTRALYNLRARGRSAAEEQGVNVLFVSCGLLHWIDPETKEEVQSPLVLVPVQLEKERGREAYALELLEDDLLLNPTLTYKLKTDFDLRLPDLPEDIEETGLAPYFDQLRGLINNRSGWALTEEAILGVFSFQKITLYQDIAEHEDLYAAHSVIAALAGSGPLPPPPQTLLATELDDRVPPSNSFQVIDADSSQQEAIEAAKAALLSPMLDVSISGAKGVLFNVTGGSDLTLFECNEAADVIAQSVDPDANIIFGVVFNSQMEKDVQITIIATGFVAQYGAGVPTEAELRRLLRGVAEESLDVPSFLRRGSQFPSAKPTTPIEARIPR